MTKLTNHRQTLLRDALQDARINILALLPGANLRYLTGFSPMLSKRIVLAFFSAEDRPPAFALPALEAPAVRAALGEESATFHPWTDTEGPAAAVQAALREMGLPAEARIGVEFTNMRVQELRAAEQAAAAFNISVVTEDATRLIGRLRMVKSADEIQAMQDAAHAVEQALRETIGQARAGISEQELARFCTDAIRRRAPEGESFETIVASGPNSANPHHHPGERRLQSGDLVIVDCGAIVRGYASDITRTFALGEPGDEARRIYQLVQAANQAGRAAVKPNATGEMIDHAARSVIEQAGYGAYFMHRTGHGLGTEIFPVHEYPDITAGAIEPLPVGTTFTIEPGIYREGVGGVRIEDDVVITEQGGRSLTEFPRDLVLY